MELDCKASSNMLTARAGAPQSTRQPPQWNRKFGTAGPSNVLISAEIGIFSRWWMDTEVKNLRLLVK